MDKRATVLVGNGFNYFVNQYMLTVDAKVLLKKLEKYQRKNSVTEQEMLVRLDNLQKDIERYCNLLDFLKLDNYSESGETLLSKLNTFFESLDKADSSVSEKIVDELSSLVSAQINSIFNETSATNDSKHFKFVNATVKTLMKTKNRYFSVGFSEVIEKLSQQSYNVYTTNYDYIIGSVFSEKYKTETIPNFTNGGSVYNVHGHYKRKDEFGEIVCCAPELKKMQMKNDYFEKYVVDIAESTVVILFGIGLTSDPHLLKELNKKRDCVCIIIDANKERYYENHYPSNHSVDGKNAAGPIQFNFLKNNQIYFIDTAAHHSKENFLIDQINTPEKLIESLHVIANALDEVYGNE